MTRESTPARHDIAVTTITITRALTTDGDDLTGVTVDGDTTLVALLGLLELAKDTLIRDAMGETPNADKD